MKTLLLIVLTTHLATAQPVHWTTVQPGVWKATVGKPEAYNLLTFSGVSSNGFALTNLGKVPFPLLQPVVTARVVDGKTDVSVS